MFSATSPSAVRAPPTWRDERLDPALFAIAETPAPISEALATIGKIERSGINQASGGQFAYIPGGGLFPAALGDLLADVGNSYSGRPVRRAGRSAHGAVARRVDGRARRLPRHRGRRPDLRRERREPRGDRHRRDAVGIRSADVPRSVVYLTSQTHHCVDKALRISGLAECQVRHVALDDRWRMRADALAEAVEADIAAGLRPWLVVATAGTTDTGAVDPLADVADVVDAHDLWLQVDAAYGGFFVLTEHGRRLLAGIERSRSVIMDPHKGLFLPYGSGALIVRDEAQLAEAHRYSATYLRDAREEGGVFSPSDLSVELSRPFRGPRLWLPAQGVRPRALPRGARGEAPPRPLAPRPPFGDARLGRGAGARPVDRHLPLRASPRRCERLQPAARRGRAGGRVGRHLRHRARRHVHPQGSPCSSTAATSTTSSASSMSSPGRRLASNPVREWCG